MIPLGRAVLCLDDSIIFNGTAGPRCPACGSTATFPIARWLNRPRPVTLTVSPLTLVEYATAAGIDVSPEVLT